jgi:hypothetical protein
MVVPEFNDQSVSIEMSVHGFNSERVQCYSPKQTNGFVQHLEPRACGGNANVVLPPHMRTIYKNKKRTRAVICDRDSTA